MNRLLARRPRRRPRACLARSCVALAAAIGILLPSAPAWPQQPDKSADVSPDEEAIRRATVAYHQAVERGDLEAIAKFWTPEADYVDHQGHAFKIHAAMQAAKSRAEEGGRIARPQLKTETLAIRLITPDVAVEDGLVERSSAAGEPLTKGRYAAVWVKRDGAWRIDGVRESAYSPVVSNNHFQDLDWLVGDWVAKGPDATAEISCTWGPDKTYLLRQTQLAPKNGPRTSATQWIGWDPVHERVHSFEFDSRGGYGEGMWTKDGDAWVVSTSGVRPDGERTTVTDIYTRLDANTAQWELVDEPADAGPGRDWQLRMTRKASGK